MALDDIVLEPLAKGYNKLPSPIKTGTSNFTSNIGTLLSIPNNILQGNFKQLGHSVGKFCDKYYCRYFRIFKSCRKNWLKPHKEDVGQTLGSYGIGTRMLFCSSNFWANNSKRLCWNVCRYFCRSICSCNNKRKRTFWQHQEIVFRLLLC